MAQRKRFDWENLSVLARSKEPGHALALSYPSEREALRRGASPLHLSLNGRWKFGWYKGVGTFPRRAEDPALDDAGWADITVPGVWELQGHGRPFYYATSYPQAIGTREKAIPHISHGLQELGVYRRRFSLPEAFAGKRVFLHFGAAKSALEVYLNGRFLGYSQGSMTPHEFDATPLLRPGENQLTAKVYRYSDGTYLEDQDMWFFSGLYRDVFLYAEPPACIRDYYMRAAFDAEMQTATALLDITLQNYGEAAPLQVQATLPGAGITLGAAAITLQGRQVLRFSAPVPRPRLWSHETPHLYDVLLALTTNGETTYKAFRFGFRRVDIRGNQIYLNNKRLFIRGVNRHDYDPDHGWALPEARYREDIRLIKQLNINSLRTSHYPNDPRLYDLCDEYGILVMDEADLESHGARRLLPLGKPEWEAPCVDRMQRMVLRDRNHPCVFFWSLGNEAGGGENFAKMRRAAEALDATRPFHYEGEHSPASSDVISRMYPNEATLHALGRMQPIPAGRGLINRLAADNKQVPAALYAHMPVLLCEYAHAMENSLGNFCDYMDAFDTYPNLCGGYIWDFVDQAIRRKTPEGDQWLYGDDFVEGYDAKNGLKPRALTGGNGCFCANGLLAADRTPHPAAYEAKQGYRPLRITQGEAGGYTLHNRQMFTTLAPYRLHWQLCADGAPLAEGDVNPALYAATPPEDSCALRPPLPPYGDAAGEITLLFTWHLAQNTPWADAGHQVAFEQFLLREAPPPAAPSSSALPAPTLRRQGGDLLVQGQNFTCRFAGGRLAAWVVNGTELLVAPLQPNHTRALTDNDRGYANFAPFIGRFLAPFRWRRAAGKEHPAGRPRATQLPGAVRVDIRWHSPLLRRAHTTYTLHADGSLEVEHTAQSRRLPMLRSGMALTLSPLFTHAAWYGRGPHENYIDRKMGAPLGLYEAGVDALPHPYMRPQENGTRSDVRHLVLRGAHGALQATDLSGNGFYFSAWPYSQAALDAATHQHTLPRADYLTLNIDGAMCGVGGDLPGVAALHAPYTLPAGRPYTTHFLLRPQSICLP